MNRPSPLDRRALLLRGSQALVGLLVSRWASCRLALADDASPPAVVRPPAPARACIVLYLNGGPSQLDTFDPKPGTRTGGPFKAIKTRAPAIRLSQHLPQLAEQADKLAIVRGLATKEGNHQRAQYLLHTGYAPNPTVVHPALGAWVARGLGQGDADLPPFISLGGPSASAGILGAQHGPFVVASAGALPDDAGRAPGVSEERFARRAAGLTVLERAFASEVASPIADGRAAVYGKAMRLMRSPRLRAFDLTDEPAALAAAYGDSDFGRRCLTARRLVEAGVKFVEVVLDGWDTHQNNFDRVKALSHQLDPAMAMLLRDLASRQLLASTLVLCVGDFGRTPTINANEGRDHYPQATFAVLAGGGLRGGVVRGETDAEGVAMVRDATTVPDLFATLSTQLGLSPDLEETAPSGRPVRLTDHGAPLAGLVAT